MYCPKCGTEMADIMPVCPACGEEIKEREAIKKSAGEEQPAKINAPAEDAPPQKAKSKVSAKKIVLMCGAFVLALFLAIAAIYGIVTAVKSSTGPEKTAEVFAEAMAEGNAKKVLRKYGPWVKRNYALMLDLKENASVGKIARELEEMGGVEKLGKVTIKDSYIIEYEKEFDGSIKEYTYDLESRPTYKELKNITELATVRVEAKIKNINATYDASFDIVCARYNGSWIVIDFDMSK